jgi:hypothetical protein
VPLAPANGKLEELHMTEIVLNLGWYAECEGFFLHWTALLLSYQYLGGNAPEAL